MNITFITLGSQGDVQPMIAVGKELIKRNHNVKIGTFNMFKDYIEKNGVNFQNISGDGKRLIDLVVGVGLGPIQMWKGLASLFNEYKDVFLNDLYEVCKGSDLIVYSLAGAPACHIAKMLNIKCMRFMYFPLDSTGDFPIFAFPQLPLGRGYNKFTYRMFEEGILLFVKKNFNGWLKEFGIGEIKEYPYKKINDQFIITIYPFSSSLVKKPPEWKEHIYITGSCFLDEDVEFTPDEGLINFINSGETPIYIGFGSMVAGSFDNLLKIVLKALKNTNQRAIISSGWAHMTDEELPSNVYSIDFVPHSWLFKNVSAVVHHGGAGTTAIGLKNGLPTLIIPFGGDQYFWGNQVYISGLGPKPIKRKQINERNLTKAIADLVSNIEYKVNAKDMAEQISKEDGVANICNIILDGTMLT